MTEASITTGRRPNLLRSRPVAFLLALTAVPAAIAALGAVTTGVGLGIFLVGSAVFGAPSYWLVFGPLAWTSALRGGRGAVHFAALGFVANLLAAALFLGFGLLLAPEPEQLVGAATFVAGFGVVFAPLYGALFGLAFARLLHRS